MKQLEKERQRVLSELDQAGYRGSLCPALQERYNRIVDDQWVPLLPDPLMALPPELCIEIFREVVLEETPRFQLDSLLILTGVSKNWCQYMISSSSLWTNIYLSQLREDDLAKLATCLTLSREREITLYPYHIDHAREAYLMALMPHKNRIAKIIWENTTQVVAFPFVQSLGYLPALKRIDFPVQFEPVSQTEKQFAQLLHTAPSFVSPIGLTLTAEMLNQPRAMEFRDIDTNLPFSEVLRIFKQNRRASISRPSVLNLDLLSPLTDVDTENSPETSLRLDRLSLFHPSRGYGNLFKHYFQDIRCLHITIATDGTLGELFVALRYSPKVSELSLSLMGGITTIPDRSDYSTLGSLIRLDIDYGGDVIPNSSRFLERVPTIMPCLQDIYFFNSLLVTAGGFRHLGLLKYLRKLVVSTLDGPPPGADPVHLSHLETLRLRMYNLQDYGFLQLEKLQYLSTDVKIHRPSLFDARQIIPVSYIIPPSSFTVLGELFIGIPFPVNLQLKFLPALHDLGFSHDTTGTWMGEILEQLILNPKICPKLSILRLWPPLVEWDLLLLMLLRRNFLHDRTVSEIGEVFVSCWLGVELLSAISSLLRGRFVSKLDLDEFSLERVAQVLYHTPSESSRCARCNCALLDSCKEADANPFYTLISKESVEAIESGWEYRLATNALPDPPLPDYMSQWLAGKWDRRRAFVAGYRAAESRGQASGACPPFPDSGVRISGFTLEGVNFDDAIVGLYE